jgi:transcriptional regulator with XRE-family HTH domain
MLRKMLGKNMKRLRLELKLNQATVAKRVGVTQPYIVALEKGRENPTLATLEKLAKALKVSVAELVK